MTPITALGRTIPQPITTELLPPIALVEYADWEASLFAGASGGGVSPRIAAIWLFCIFTSALPRGERIDFRSAVSGQFTTENLNEMIVAGGLIVEVLYPAAVEPPNVEADEPKARKGQKSSEVTGSDSA